MKTGKKNAMGKQESAACFEDAGNPEGENHRGRGESKVPSSSSKKELSFKKGKTGEGRVAARKSGVGGCVFQTASNETLSVGGKEKEGPPRAIQ